MDGSEEANSSLEHVGSTQVFTDILAYTWLDFQSIGFWRSLNEPSPLKNDTPIFHRQPTHGGSSRGLSSNSSAHNTDADDSDSDAKKHQKDRRRERHTKAEQMRRDQIKKG